MSAAATVYGTGNIVCSGSTVLVPVSVSLMIEEYFYPLYGMFVHPMVIPGIKFPSIIRGFVNIGMH